MAIDGSKFRAINSKAEPDAPTPEQVRAAIQELTQRKDGFHCCYNVQTAVDKGSHLISIKLLYGK